MDSDLDALFHNDFTEINCVDKFIGDDKCRRLCNRILDNSSSGGSRSRHVKRIVLRGICINVNGAQALADVLSLPNVELSGLSVEWNQLGSTGAIFIADALVRNESLLHLDLKNNGIGDDGASALAVALNTNETLKVLDLRWNQISDKGALAFETIVKERQRTRPVSVLLAGNLVTSGIMSRIDEWTMVQEPQKEEKTSTSAPPTRQIDYSAITLEVNKEVQMLRSQVSALTQKHDDTMRQLDTSAYRITELEHMSMREQFRVTQLDEALKQAKMRITEQQNEKKGIS